MLVAGQLYEAPFDAVAARYDRTFTSSKIGRAQRASVWRELAKTFNSGDRVLEIGCGTGVDACFLAERGLRVVATDSSAQMIEVATGRVLNTGLQEFVQPLLLPAEAIGTLSTSEPFDGAFSNFGALNCVADLRQLSRDLARVIRPGASALLCWMGPFCLWETIWYAAHWKWEKAFRRFHGKDGIVARVADGAFVRVNYPSMRLLKRTFAPYFQLESIKGVGVAVPPSYLEPWAERHPRLLDLCERVDSRLAPRPGIRSLADHVLLRFVRTTTTSSNS